MTMYQDNPDIPDSHDNVSRWLMNLDSGEKAAALEAQLYISSEQSRSLDKFF